MTKSKGERGRDRRDTKRKAAEGRARKRRQELRRLAKVVSNKDGPGGDT